MCWGQCPPSALKLQEGKWFCAEPREDLSMAVHEAVSGGLRRCLRVVRGASPQSDHLNPVPTLGQTHTRAVDMPSEEVCPSSHLFRVIGSGNLHRIGALGHDH